MSANDRIKSREIERLWQAATDYEFQFISGSAIGLVTAGVIQGKPKCMAVAAWQSDIWDAYYAAKARVNAGDRGVRVNFEQFGTIPYTVPELKEEIFG